MKTDIYIHIPIPQTWMYKFGIKLYLINFQTKITLILSTHCLTGGLSLIFTLDKCQRYQLGSW